MYVYNAYEYTMNEYVYSMLEIIYNTGAVSQMGIKISAGLHSITNGDFPLKKKYSAVIV